MSKIYACIWSNDKAAEMAKFYKSIFKGTKIGKTSYWGSNPMGVKEGSVLTMHLTVLGHDIPALSCVGFITTFQRGTEWAATGKVTQKIPAGFPTAETVSFRVDIAAMDPGYKGAPRR